jgi:hypothetical protein
MKFWILYTRRRTWNPLSWLIMKLQKLEYSHVVILVDSERIQMVYESTFPNAKESSLGHFQEKNLVVEKAMLPMPMNENQAMKVLKDLVWKSEGYSFAQLFLIALGMINANINKLIGTVILNHEHYLICTELVGRFYEQAYGHKFDEHEDTLDLHDIKKATKEITGV